MTTTDINASSLAPIENYSTAVSSSVTAFKTIDTTETTINSISVPPDPAVPNLETHLQNAKDVANNWNNNIRPQIVTSLKNVSGYATLFNSLYSQLSANAVAIQLNEGDKVAMTNFKAEIKLLQDSTKSLWDSTISVQTSLSAFQNDTSAVVRNFQSDLQNVQTQVSVDQQQMQTLYQQMSYLQEKLAEAEEQKEELTSGWMTVITFGLSQLVAVIENLQGNVNQLRDRIGSVQGQLSQDEQEIQSLSIVANNLSTLLGLSNVLQTTVVVFITNWQSLSNNLNELEGIEGIGPTDAWAESDLQAVNSEWQVITSEISSLI